MQCGYDKELLTRFLHGELSDEERASVEEHLSECAECRREWESYRRMWGVMDSMGVPEPAADTPMRFQAMLDSYRHSLGSSSDDAGRWAGEGARGSGGWAGEEGTRGSERWAGEPGVRGSERWAGEPRGGIWARVREIFRVHPGFAMGYSLLLVVVGLGVGYWVHRPGVQPGLDGNADGAGNKKELAELTAQVGEMREMMMKSLLQNPSASERMRGVSYTSEIHTVSPTVIEALLSTLNNDPNANVRLMTLEALTHYANNPLVREGLVQSITQQESPLVQAALADVMLRLQEKKAIRPFKKLLQQKDLNGMVRSRIEETIFRLS